ncbi:MAG: AAA family ATPase [Candidatus Altiarchaeota archaeon]
MTLVIGLVGRIASGKGEVAKFLEKEFGAKTFVFSDILKDVLVRLHIRVERGNLQTLGEELRRDFGADTLVNAMREDIAKYQGDIVVVDGIRFPNEVQMVRGFPENKLLYIDAPQNERYKRACLRGTRGEATLSFEEFQAIEQRETEKHLDEVIGQADHRIENTGTLEVLKEKVREIIESRA